MPSEDSPEASSGGARPAAAYSTRPQFGLVTPGVPKNSHVTIAPAGHGAGDSFQWDCPQCTLKNNRRAPAACCSVCACARQDSKFITWPNASTAVVWQMQAVKCDLFEGHGAYQSIRGSRKVTGAVKELPKVL